MKYERLGLPPKRNWCICFFIVLVCMALISLLLFNFTPRVDRLCQSYMERLSARRDWLFQPNIAISKQFNSKPEEEKVFKHPYHVHFIRIFSNSDATWHFTFLQYSAVRSAWKAISPIARKNKAECVINVHSSVKPTGFYWQQATFHDQFNLKWHYVDRIPKFGLTPVAAIEHEADFHKLNSTFFYGGIHMDFDVLLINSSIIENLQKQGECVLAVDVDKQLPRKMKLEYFFNAGFFSCIQYSPFLHLWKNNYYVDYHSNSFLYNSGIFPTILKKTYPYPIAEDWGVGMQWRRHLLSDLPQDYKQVLPWRSKSGIHFYHIEHEKFNWADAYYGKSVFAQVMRYVHSNSSLNDFVDNNGTVERPPWWPNNQTDKFQEIL